LSPPNGPEELADLPIVHEAEFGDERLSHDYRPAPRAPRLAPRAATCPPPRARAPPLASSYSALDVPFGRTRAIRGSPVLSP
jgi:hypothetical protein